jgi:RNA polymerase sigma factor (sigma-70 family)
METGLGDHDLDQLVARAKAGDRIALEGVVRAVQDDVFDLALRMLGHVDDASDASQEILVRLVTKLDSFRGESRFRTWVYRVTAHALLNYRTRLRRPEIDFDEAAGTLEAALANAPNAPTQTDPAHKALVNEVKLACAAGMLICLDRAHRLAYILGEVLELQGEDAAAILEISPVGFRKRLSRAREQMEAFLRSHCGIANPAHPCRCKKLVPAAIEAGLVDPDRLSLSRLPHREADRLHLNVERIRTAAEMYRSMPKYAAPNDFAAAIRETLKGGHLA